MREAPPERRRPGVVHAAADIRDRSRLEALLREHAIDTVVHLAAIVTPGKKADRDFGSRSTSSAPATSSTPASPRAWVMS